MSRLLRRFTRRDRGFTLVEILVVLAILTILSAILIPSLSGYIENASQKALIASCRACVQAAQTISAEDYAMTGQVTLQMTDEPVRKLAGVTEGRAYDIVINNAAPNKCKVDYLTYENGEGRVCFYRRELSPHYYFSMGEEWKIGTSYKVGDVMTFSGFVFECIRNHTSGTTSRTRNPALRSNKSTWQVIGNTNGTTGTYSSTVRFATGATVIYKGNYYVRTDFNLVGGQVPYEGTSSDYWTFIGPAEDASA